jgi:hypothetical protein
LQDRIFKMIQKYDEIHVAAVLRDSEKKSWIYWQRLRMVISMKRVF